MRESKHQNPDTSKEGREFLAGTDTLTLNGLSEGAKDIIIVVKDDAGNVSNPLVIRIPDIKKKNTDRQWKLRLGCTETGVWWK